MDNAGVKGAESILQEWIKMQSKQHTLRKIQINVGMFPGESEEQFRK